MGSSCELFLDEDLSLTGQKSHVPDLLRALFQESDRYEFSDPENGIEIIEYRASRECIHRQYAWLLRSVFSSDRPIAALSALIRY